MMKVVKKEDYVLEMKEHFGSDERRASWRYNQDVVTVIALLHDVGIKVAYIVGGHQTASKDDGLDFQIILGSRFDGQYRGRRCR